MAERPPIESGEFAEDTAATLIAVVGQTLADLHPGRESAVRVTLDSALDRDLGFDSLARVELLLRLEKAFGVSFPEDALQRVESVRDLLGAIGTASRSVAERSRVSAAAAVEPAARADPAETGTLLDVLDWHVRAHPLRTQIVHMSDAGEEAIRYVDLRRQAEALAAGLQAEGLEPRQAVAIMLPTCPDYFYVYFGILLAGGIPVPIYPPVRLAQIEDHVRRHAGILENAQAAILVTVPEAMPVARLLEAQVPGLRRVITVGDLEKAGGQWSRVAVATEDIAFLQYTSGSTGNPKGVVLTHANLLANIRAMGQAVRAGPEDIFVSWLPLYHDMGLIGAWLASLYFGFPLAVMSPLAFLTRPARWLWAIHRHRGTLSAAPNFAYELCLKRIEEADVEGLDLSSWRLAFNGAEAVSPDTLVRFAERFARYGLKREALTPVYGLAESSVGLTFPPLERGPLIDRVQRPPFMREGQALLAAGDDSNPLRFVACGRPLPGHEVRIVDAAGLEVGERVEGRLHFNGPSATAGYYRNPEQTRRLFHGAWLDSGDRAYMAGGEVYITGRDKDIIIRGGRNIYPPELEEAVGEIKGVRRGCVAVFGSPEPQTGTERLVVLAETRETDTTARERLRTEIVRTTVDLLGEPPDEVVLAPPHAVLKTSSGKIRRSACRELYDAGLIGARAPVWWWQIARLMWAAALPQARRWLAASAAIAYSVYAWAVLGVLGAPVWVAMLGVPRVAWARAFGRAAARLLFALCGARVTVRGLEHLPREAPHLVVANHGSYLDGFVLSAVLPPRYGIVAKRELAEHIITGPLLRRLGAQFVERFETQQSLEDANRLAQAVSAGTSLIFFPEGTFKRATGLLPFRLGAFIAAAGARVPVVPVAIRGTRAILRGDQKLVRHGNIEVTVEPPIAPPTDAADGFAAAVRLRDAARAAILRHCGEPNASA